MFFLGLDLGQASDYTALVILQRVILPAAEPTQGDVGAARPAVVHYHARHIQRWPLGTTYPDIVRAVARLTRAAPIADNYALVADATGVGRPVIDLLHEADLAPVPVVITGGDSINIADDGFVRVPKRDLISSVQVLLQSGRLKFAHALPEAQTLISELLVYQVKITDSGRDTYNAREGAHDDLVLALALATWRGEQYVSPLDLIAYI